MLIRVLPYLLGMGEAARNVRDGDHNLNGCLAAVRAVDKVVSFF